jgi:hypothetical protein
MGVTEPIPDRVVALHLGGASPVVAVLVAETNEVSVSKTGDGLVVEVLEAEEPAGNPARSGTAATIDHGDPVIGRVTRGAT